MEWWAGISLGLISSLHCAGMCGPIAFALPLDRSSVLMQASGAGVYQVGRLTTYAILGALFGLLGKAFFTAGLQRSLSIIVGIAFILAVAIPLLTKRGLFLESLGYRFIGKIKGYFGSLFRKRSLTGLFGIGVLNGLLPCGMVYLGLAGAVSAGSYTGGGAFMLAFGMGTLPVMMAASLSGNLLNPVMRQRMRKAVPYLVVLMGVWFILRGMNLGIPYLSPIIDQVDPAITNCE